QEVDYLSPKKGSPVVFYNTLDIGIEEFPEPVTHWIENWAGCTEKLCREEAKDIGFTCVIIRSGIYTKTNQYNEDGTNVVTDDDPHITIYIGFGLDELVKALFNMRFGREKVASEYWLI
ncbi:hypothetical protein NEUTE2DRAFT_66145, partial [Neurospora tetrasperma FGSC 2509]